MKKRIKPVYGFFSNAAFLFRHAKQYVGRVITHTVAVMLVGIALNLAELFVAPMILEKIETQAPWVSVLATVAVFTAAIFVLRWLDRYLDGLFWESRDLFRVTGTEKLVRKALTTSYPHAVDPERLKMLNRAAEAIGYHNNAPVPHMWRSFANLLINVTGLLIYATLLSHLNILLVIVTAVTAAVNFLVFRFANEWGYRHRDEEAEHNNRIAYVAHVAESAELTKDIRVFGLAPWLQDIHDSGVRAITAFVERRAKVYVWTNIVDALLTFLRNGIAYVVLIQMALTEHVSTAEFLLYFSAIGGFTMWVRGILFDVSTLHRESLELSIYREYLEQDEPFVFEGGERPQSGQPHHLCLSDVTFAYPGSSSPLFEHLHLEIRAGEKVAIVGPSGAGKTTLVRLLCGLYDPNEGAVELDGKDIRSFDRRAYYSLFSCVFQENSMLEVTVAQSVAQQTDGIDIPRVWECLKTAGLDGVVRTLPNGLHTHIGRAAFDDGVLLSGGQIQRLLLARALYKNGDLLILDEPTAALDPIAEHELYQEYARMTHGKSAVFISHRLASTRFCDRIVYLSNGKIVEEGTHEELLAKGGEYAALFEVQSRYYREGSDPDVG